MTFSIDFVVTTCDPAQPLTHLLAQPDLRAATAGPVRDLVGHLSIIIDGQEAPSAYEEPMLRLVDLWLRKIPWIVGGDTETVTLRNSEHCFAFMPAGHSVELSFFAGTESEIEESLLDPVTVRTETFVAGVLGLGGRVWSLCQRTDGSEMVSADDPVRDLETSLSEAKKAWHDHQIHQRR